MQDAMITTALSLPATRLFATLALCEVSRFDRDRSSEISLGASRRSLAETSLSTQTFVKRPERKPINLCVSMPSSTARNAIIAMRYDATELMDGLTEVLCYGTRLSSNLGRVPNPSIQSGRAGSASCFLAQTTAACR